MIPEHTAHLAASDNPTKMAKRDYFFKVQTPEDLEYSRKDNHELWATGKKQRSGV
jgi:hypothetical protein